MIINNNKNCELKSIIVINENADQQPVFENISLIQHHYPQLFNGMPQSEDGNPS